MSNELVVSEQQQIASLPVGVPEAVLEQARKAAQALQRVVSAKPHKVVINNEQYLEFEDWQTVGKFYGLSVEVEYTRPVDFGDVRGFEARANVIHTASGAHVSSAEAMCLNDEDRWGNRPLFQLRSMAQTRACAKAFRNCLAWVVVLAGYKGTPAEELMGDEGASRATPQEHWCPIHNCKFFKTGKMRSYAHKIEGTDKWCNEDDLDKADDATDGKRDGDKDNFFKFLQGSLIELEVALDMISQAKGKDYSQFSEVWKAITPAEATEIIRVQLNRK